MRKLGLALLLAAIHGRQAPGPVTQTRGGAAAERIGPIKTFGAAYSAQSLVQVSRGDRRESSASTTGPRRLLAMLMLRETAAFAPNGHARSPVSIAASKAYTRLRTRTPTGSSVASMIRDPPSNRGIQHREILTASELDDPLAEQEDPLNEIVEQLKIEEQKAEEEKRKKNEYNANVGEAIDSIEYDLPRILDEQPNWGVYADDLVLDLERLNPVALRVLDAVTPIEDTVIRGLEANKFFVNELHTFRKIFVEDGGVKTRRAVKTKDRHGEPVIECRWVAEIRIRQFPGVRFFRGLLSRIYFVKSPKISPNLRDTLDDPAFTVNAISRFYLNSEGRINRHVVDNLISRPNLEMPDANNLLAILRDIIRRGGGGATPLPAR